MGRYRLEEPIGSGSFGTVWRALDGHLDREVAVKAIPSEHAGERADREIRAAARLSHPGVVTLHEASADGTHTYIVSEFVRGSTLAELLADGTPSDRDIARIGAALAAALDHAHGHGVIHRDVKPGNVLIPDAPRSEAGIVKLADFGIARLAGESSLTRTGDVVGTLAWMAPEQAAGSEVEAASDLWALGLIVFEGFAGFNPMRGATPAETARNLAQGPPESLAEHRGDLPGVLISAVDTALEWDPADRGSVAGFGVALGEAAHLLGDEPGSIAPAVRRGGGARSPRTALPPAERQYPQVGPPGDSGLAGLPGQGVPAPRKGWIARVLASLTGAALAIGWSFTLAPPFARPDRWLIAAGAGILIGLAPRAGWIMSAAAAAAALAWAGEPGEAVVLAAAVLPAIPLLWQSPQWFSLTWLAPGLGFAGFGGAWPALASFGSGPFTRGAVAAVGAWQLACAELLLGRDLLGPSAAAGSAALWRDDVSQVIPDALKPLLTGPAPIVALIWAAGAVALPILVRGRSAVTDAVCGALWAVGIGLATAWATGGVARGALAGSLAGAALVVAVRGFRDSRSEPHGGGGASA